MATRASWVEGADSGETDFPLANLPCGVFDDGRGARMGVAIGESVLDVARVDHGLDPELFAEPAWNRFMAAGPQTWEALRGRLTDLLSDERRRGAVEPHLVSLAAARLLMPFRVSEFTDFYSCRHHAANVGAILRGADGALPPNWLSLPAGYNGRASSVAVSGAPVRRPWGQILDPDAALPRFAPSARFDFELEMGAVVGQPSDGMIPVAWADEMIFGYVLLNDWSARDVQAWESQPLGPFQSKAAATTISPWIVTRAALEPFRAAGPERERPLLGYLREPGPMLYDIALEAAIAPKGKAETVVARTSHAMLHYSAAQQLAHHAACGCPMRVGDLLGSGTISGPGRRERGCMLELSWGGAEPVELDTGERRGFLEDGDTVSLRGRAGRGAQRIGFGECAGTVLAARPRPEWITEETA